MKWLRRKRWWVVAVIALVVAIATTAIVTRERLVITFLGIQDEGGERVAMFQVKSRYLGQVMTGPHVYLRTSTGTEKTMRPRWEAKDELRTRYGGWLKGFQFGTRARIGIPLPAFADDVNSPFQMGIEHFVERSAIWNYIPYRFRPKWVESSTSRKTWSETITP